MLEMVSGADVAVRSEKTRQAGFRGPSIAEV